MPLDDLSREPDHDRRLQLMHFSCARNGRQFREFGGFYSHYSAGGFALWRRRNSIRRYSATPEREFESQFPLFLLDNHSTYINSCFCQLECLQRFLATFQERKGNNSGNKRIRTAQSYHPRVSNRSYAGHGGVQQAPHDACQGPEPFGHHPREPRTRVA